MPRNASSVYSLPAGNPVIPGTIIATTWANSTLTDIATALTNSLSTDGSTASVSLAGKTMSGGTFSSPTVSGALNLTSGQIAFPAVQVPSANVNTLDDYEEGTWTPTLSFQTPGNLVVAYSTQVGTYNKIGRFVSAQFSLLTSTFTHTTASGALVINGLPFTCLGGSAGGRSTLSWQTITTGAFTDVAGQLSGGTTNLAMIMSGSGQPVTPVGTGQATTGTTQLYNGSVDYSAV